MFNDPKDSPAIQRAISGEYSVSVKQVLKKSWQLTQQNKLPVLFAFLFAVAINIGAQHIMSLMLGGGEGGNEGIDGVANLIATLIAAPFWGGLDMMALRRSRGAPVQVTDVFNYLKYFAPLALVQVLITILLQLGLVLLLLPAIYLAVGTSFAIMLMLDRGISPTKAVYLSIRAAHHQWFKLFLVFLALTPAMGLAAIPLAVYLSGQGMEQVQSTMMFSLLLIWAVPMLYFAKGVMFDAIFGDATVEEPVERSSTDDGSFSA
ncbi:MULTISPECIES: hypothetical protein [Corallincola]|uniref:Uncharacterized protein n=3 Tax=Corallincola TaxID=1775176 RepID=A0A368NU00_9GAMM|nr:MULTISPECIES: hypothetical protein [Corallincola]RCU52691.1 hypothetical protein DU002_01630 [Corallincola holothuriorum]TAA48129.1 hypothetical protein EXY25_02495 [Corallincola spongiicola]TCI03191.1 hypothetical protein EZV61_09915 [Corallincola luteus]